MKTMIGYCSSCGDQVLDLSGPRPVMLPNFREHTIMLSDWSMMRVGVCDVCKEKLISGQNIGKTADKILKNHKTYWRGKQSGPIGFEDMTVADPDTDTTKYRRDRAMKIHKDKKLR